MSNLKKIVHLTDEQLATLKSTGTVTGNGITLNYSPEDTLYVTPHVDELSDLQNDVGYVTEEVETLVNYHTKDTIDPVLGFADPTEQLRTRFTVATAGQLSSMSKPVYLLDGNGEPYKIEFKDNFSYNIIVEYDNKEYTLYGRATDYGRLVGFPEDQAFSIGMNFSLMVPEESMTIKSASIEGTDLTIVLISGILMDENDNPQLSEIHTAILPMFSALTGTLKTDLVIKSITGRSSNSTMLDKVDRNGTGTLNVSGTNVGVQTLLENRGNEVDLVAESMGKDYSSWLKVFMNQVTLRSYNSTNGESKINLTNGNIDMVLQGNVTVNGKTVALVEDLPEGTDFTPIYNRIDEVTGTIRNEYVAADSAVSSEVSTLKGTVQVHGADIEGVKTRLGTAETNIAAKASATEFTTLANKVNSTSSGLDTKAPITEVSTLKDKVSGLETTTGSHTASISSFSTKITNLETNNSSQDGKITSLETATSGLSESIATINGEIDGLEAADSALDKKITDETTNRTNADNGLQGQITENLNKINSMDAVIPSAATSANQLADKKFVTDAITSSTADFQGSFATYDALAKASITPGKNDYAVVLDATDYNSANEGTWKFKYNGTSWIAEYMIEGNGGLTATQSAALNSGVTSTTVAQVGTNKTNISTNATNIANLTTTVNGHTTSIGTANTNITTLTDRLNKLTNNTGSASAAPTSIKIGNATIRYDSSTDTIVIE